LGRRKGRYGVVKFGERKEECAKRSNWHDRNYGKRFEENVVCVVFLFYCTEEEGSTVENLWVREINQNFGVNRCVCVCKWEVQITSLSGNSQLCLKSQLSTGSRVANVDRGDFMCSLRKKRISLRHLENC
jgi:hypothetical protein